MAAGATIVPKAQGEVTANFKFYGPDIGAFPAAQPGGASTSGISGSDACSDDIDYDGGTQFTDFSCGQDLASLNRISKKDWNLNVTMKFRHPDVLYKEWLAYGPLVLLLVTVANNTGGATSFTATFKGIMSDPGFRFLGSPATMNFEIRSYGLAPTIVHGA